MKRFFVFLAGIVCFSGICLSNTNEHTLVVNANSDVFWDCVLKPYESAKLTITVGATPSGYRLESTTPSITNSSPDFCWVGGYSVVNSAGVSASTRVTVKCVWVPIGGPGPGTPPPILYGSAAGTAVAQPTNYWNIADTPVVAVGTSVLVNAYKDDSEPAPSTWSISGPATIYPAGASATVKGTAPSANNFDVIVTSVCNECSATDDEYLTVVGVKSIKANPDIVEVGNANVSFEIKTQPEGYNGMVSYTPPDFNVPGSNDVVATCGTSAATCTVTVVGADIAAFDRVPPGEETRQVNVTVTPSPLPSGYSISLVCEADPGTTGSADVSPETINETTDVDITGDTQSGELQKDNIKLKAKFQGTVLASEAFTVCAHVEDVSVVYSREYPEWRNVYGFYCQPTVTSDSDDINDLDKVFIRERLLRQACPPPFIQPADWNPGQYIYVPPEGEPCNETLTEDGHNWPKSGGLDDNLVNGSFKVDQQWQCKCKRCGVDWSGKKDYECWRSVFFTDETWKIRIWVTGATGADRTYNIQ
ncbi:MAG: hypothetical protein Q7J98_12905 [Kiritimatiellia bacterium]|nr:hypothetical protein [Kiritimatiellia bacterium]